MYLLLRERQRTKYKERRKKDWIVIKKKKHSVHVAMLEKSDEEDEK